MADGVWVALFAAVLGPVLLAWLQGVHERRRLFQEAQMRRAEKREDWARQDEVAARLSRQNEKVAASAKKANDKLDVIHVLVNSNMTSAMQAELDATRRDLISLREVARLNQEAGRVISDEAQAVIEETGRRIEKLASELAARLEQATASEAMKDGQATEE